MIDPADEQSPINGSLERHEIQSDAFIRPNLIAVALRASEGMRNHEPLKTLINIKTQLKDPEDSETWNLVIVELLRIISTSDDVGCERVLLASLALVNVLFRSRGLEDYNRQLIAYWTLEVPILKVSGEEFEIRDVEWFKLAITYGYLRVNIKMTYSRDTMSVPFELLRRNCLRYTRYSYFAHKTLQSWLVKTSTTNFWFDDDAESMEKDLEAIIYSNWDSSILEIARINSTQIFPTYLRIMCAKYDRFSNFIFENCMQNLSWQNGLKYTILTEVHNMGRIRNYVKKLVNSDLPSCLFTSLTKNHLKYPGTKLYLSIIGKLEKNEWQEIFGDSLFRVSSIWESEEQETAIELLWDQWMRPTIVKFPDIFEFLWKHDSMKRLKLSRSYLEKIGDFRGFELVYDDKKISDVLTSRVIDISEPVRLNAFAIICQLQNWKIAIDVNDPFATLKSFLFFNVDTSSIFMRKGIVKNFKIFFANAVRLADKDPNVESHIHNFIEWLHTFLLDCFELGSSYQRKILALSIYEIVLIPTSFDDCRMGLWNANNCQRERRKFINSAKNLRRKMSVKEKWFYCDWNSAGIIYSLVYDPINEVRDKAVFILLQYFCKDVFSTEELESCWMANAKNYRSSNFHNIEIGATIEKIRNLWGVKANPPFYNDRLGTIHKHIELSRNQLSKMQETQDILHCLKSNSPVYGSLMIILEVGFLIGPVDGIYDESTVRKMLDLTEDVTKFFLLALSPEARDIKCSSSFNDMARAIETSIRNSGWNVGSESISSSAHQLFIFCIWMSLKVSCEIAAELGLIAETEETARRSVELIVSVLLKCRHKGAIEAAGLALAKLTKSLSKGKYNELIEFHLTELLNIGNEDSINLTRRGAGLTIMLHRIVSSDGRRNKPWLHFAVRKLLNSLRVDDDDEPVQMDDCCVDSPRARHLHFLRSLIADKELQTQLLPYVEDICLTCFRYLQSPEWTVRNASLQLYGAVVPRLVGQCSARELDYGIGNTVDHFVTHYPILAKTIMTQLKTWKEAFGHGNENNFNDTLVNSNIVAILTLLSKMSTGGCELLDYSSGEYLSEAKKCFTALFKHPVSNVRALAGKAHAAFVALPEIPQKLAELQLESLSMNNEKTSNLEHGRFIAQLYLARKLKHELQCTSETFYIRKHKIWNDTLNRGIYLHLRLLNRIICDWLKTNDSMCYTVVSSLIGYLIESPIKFIFEDSPMDWPKIHVSIENMIDERSKPGFYEFIDDLMSLYDRLPVTHDIVLLSKILKAESRCPEHISAIVKNVRVDSSNLEFFVDIAESIVEDPTKSDDLINVVASIRDKIYENDDNLEIGSELKRRIIKLSGKLRMINCEETRPYARRLRSDGYCIGFKLDESSTMFGDTMDYITAGLSDDDDDNEAKKSSIDCLTRIVDICGNNFVKMRKIRAPWFKLIEVMIRLLTDDDRETRNSMARILHPIVRRIVDNDDNYICPRASCYKILYNLSVSVNEMTLFERNECTILFTRLVSHVRLHVAPEGLGNMFQQRDTFNPDVSFLNLLFYCVTRFIKREQKSESDESVDVGLIDGTIRAKYEIRPNPKNFKIFTNTKPSDYLTGKKIFLNKIIDDHRHEAHCDLYDAAKDKMHPEIYGY